MKILIDENLPRYLKRILVDHNVTTVQEMGWSGIKNGELLKLAEPIFDLSSLPTKTYIISRI